MTHTNDPRDLLERAVDAVRHEPVDETLERQAAERVWDRLRRDAVAQHSAGHGGACDAFRADLPAYVEGGLSAARRLLVGDHTRECIPCRRELERLRDGERTPRSSDDSGRAAKAGGRRWLAAAAVFVAALGTAGALWWSGSLATGGTVARVQSVEGALLSLDGDDATTLGVGAELAADQLVRTAGGPAVIRLSDGSRVEIASRSELSVAVRRHDTTIRVTRGSVIVEAAKRERGHLFVSTDDCLVSVTGTIFSVNHGAKGSRVSVIEGEVHVEQGGGESVLRPGDQITTRDGLARVPVADEVAWSASSERYGQLLAELAALDREIGRKLAETELRYDSRLMTLVPADTGLYVALPNVAEQIGEVHRIFEERLATSPALSAWWEERGAAGFGDQMTQTIERIRTLGGALGDEIVIALPLGSDGEPGEPLILATASSPSALAAALAAEVARLDSAGGERLVLVSDPAQAPEKDGLGLWQAGDVVAAGNRGSLLALQRSLAAGGGFAGTELGGRIAEAYSQGAYLLVGLDLGSILRGQAAEDQDGSLQAMRFAGLDGVRHLVIEQKHRGDTVHTGAVLSFDGRRHGAASWLEEPAPMGALAFVSPEARLVAAALVTDPSRIVDELEGFSRTAGDGLEAGAEVLELLRSVAAPLGGEIAFAVDGPLLPVPAWKVIVEVYDPAGLEASLQYALERVTAETAGEGEGAGFSGRLVREEVGGRVWWSLVPEGGGEALFHAAFVDGYLVAAPSRALVDRAIRTRESGYGLVDTPAFQELLPQDGYVHFSALAWHNLGDLSEVMTQIGAGAQGMDEGMAAGLEALAEPTLTCVYGEPDRIRVVSTSRGGLLGMRAGTLLGFGALAGGAG